MFGFFIGNNLISPNQSWFTLGGSSIDQLLSINHDINKSFDDRLEIRGDLLDISEAFDKVFWFSPKTKRCFKASWRVVLNVTHSSWANVEARVALLSWYLLYLLYLSCYTWPLLITNHL